MADTNDLLEVCTDLIRLVEGVGCKDWRDQNGQRFKDTNEWVRAYVAINNARKEVRKATPLPADAALADELDRMSAELKNTLTISDDIRVQLNAGAAKYLLATLSGAAARLRALSQPAQPALTTVEFDSAYNLGWHECEEKMAYESTQPATVPEAVAKDVSALDAAGQFNRKVAYAWFPLRISKKRQLISDYGITIPQGPTESDSQWAMRALHAMLERPECRAALLSAADTEVKNG